MSLLPRLLPLLAGLILGAAAVWTLRPTGSAPSVHVSSSASPASPGKGPALVLAPRLAGPDADAALDAYLALPPLADPEAWAAIADRSARLRALLTLLPDPSFERLFATLARRAGPVEAGLRRLAFDVWTERDAPAAARWAADLVPGEAIDAQARNRYAIQAAQAWARDGFDAAFAWASTLPDTALSRSVSGDLLARLADTDPTRALALARAGGDEFFAAVRRDIFRAWAGKNPAAAIQTLGAAFLSDNQARWQVTEALGKWAVADPRATFTWLDTYSGLEPQALRSVVWSLVHQVSRNGAASDIRPFADALTARTLTGQGQQQLSDLLRSWAGRDSPAALAWLDSIPDAALRNDLLEQALGNGSPGPEESLPLALHLPPGPVRDTALTNALSRWAERDADAALAWLRDHDDPSLAAVAASLQGRLLGNLAASDPAAALARWQNLPADESRIAAAPGIARAWAETDPSAAARWLFAQLPELPTIGPADFEKLSPQAQAELQQKFMAYEGHFETLAKAAAAWSRKDLPGLVAWAESMPSPLLKEGLLSSLGQNFGSYEDDVPDRALRAAEISAIPDPTLRDRILGEHLETWLRHDVKAAREWIDTHDALSPEKAAELLNRATANP